MKTTVAIVGGASLPGRELQELIRDQKLPWALRLLSGEAGEGAGTFTASGEEAAYMEPLNAAVLQESELIFLAGDAETSRAAHQLHPSGVFVDLSGSQLPGAALAAPTIGFDAEGEKQQIAHPAAMALAFLLQKLKYVNEAIVTVFEPASERGHAGIGELQKQSSNLLTFQQLPKAVFDAQIAFNLLAEYGEEAPLALSAVEDRIDRDLRQLSPASAGKVSFRLLQAPVFHAYGILAFVRMQSEVESLDSLLQGDPLIDLRTGGTEAPTNAGAAQQDGFLIGSLRRDRRDSKAWWIWVTFDNLRLSASNAISVAKQLL